MRALFIDSTHFTVTTKQQGEVFNTLDRHAKIGTALALQHGRSMQFDMWYQTSWPYMYCGFFLKQNTGNGVAVHQGTTGQEYSHAWMFNDFVRDWSTNGVELSPAVTVDLV